jgi:hypothetical protein
MGQRAIARTQDPPGKQFRRHSIFFTRRATENSSHFTKIHTSCFKSEYRDD